MTAFPNQAPQAHSPVPVPSSFTPSNFMNPPSASMPAKDKTPSNNQANSNSNSFVQHAVSVNKVNSQVPNQMKRSQVPVQNRPVAAPISAPSNASHIMVPNVQSLPNPIPPANMKPQYPALTQIMHKPNMPNMSSQNVNTNPAPVTSAPPAPSTPMPPVLPTPTNAAPVPLPKSKSSKKSKSKNNSSSNPLSNQNSSNVGAHGENTGRWTQEEHRLFLEGLEKHGKGWKKIASLIKSRTVVQIRTHAQKYFQKLAKARHNGEEGDVSMEGRGGVGIHCGGAGGPGTSLSGGMSIPSLSGDQLKRRRSSASAGNGTKRKSIETVVTSAQREGKRLKEVNDPLVIPSISPCLAPFVVHPGAPNNVGQHVQNNGAHEMIPPSAPSLEESLYRFLTPMSADYSIQPPSNNNTVSQHGQSNGLKPQTNDPNNQNQYIVLPNNPDHLQFSEGSPTGVTDIPTFPNFPSNKLPNAPNPTQDPPQWYARGADVDELLHDADALNWLADTGDLDEPFKQQTDSLNSNCTQNLVHFNNSEVVSLSESESNGSTTVNETNRNLATDALPPVVASTSSEDIHGLPNLFDSGVGSKSRAKLSTPNLFSAGSTGNMVHSSSGNLVDENFSVFDSAMDEQAFVSALLESNENAALSVSAEM